jgi:dihydroorotase-like cyclic amidohydrolase
MSLLIRGGTVVNHDHSRRADVLIEGDTIVAVAAAIAAPTGAETIDAGGAYVIPGGIDPHTHLEMPFMGTVTADDFESGTKAALSAKRQMSRIDYNVFEGFGCTGGPAATLSRGRIVWKDGDLRAEAGDGHYVERPAFSPVHVANSTWKELTAPRAVARGAMTP